MRLWFALWLSLAAHGAPDPVGTLEQQELPALRQRQDSARARREAAARYFAGEGPWEVAFPELVDASLGDPGALLLRQEALRLRSVARAAERVAPLPPLPAPEAERLRHAREASCDAEDAADALEQRFLSGILAGLDRAPGLTEPPFAAREAQLQATTRLPQDADEVTVRAALAANARLEALRAWRRAAWQAMTRVDPALDTLVEGVLQRPPMDWSDEAELEAALDRLLRVRPLLANPAVAQPWIDAAEARLYTEALVAARLPAARGPATEANLTAARAQREERAATLARLDADPASSPVALELARARLQQADALVRALEAEQELAAQLGEPGLGGARDAAEAEELAAKARESAEAAATTAEAGLRAATVELRETAAAEVRTEIDRRIAALAEIAALRTALDAGLAAYADAGALAALDPDRDARLDAAYLALRDLTNELHDQALVRAQRVDALRRLELDQEPTPAGASEARRARDAALADLRAVRQDTLTAAIEEQDAVLALMIEAKSARRDAREHASHDARTRGQRAFLPELMVELREARLTTAVRLRGVARAARALPARATDLAALSALLQGSAKVLLWVLAAATLRRAIPARVERLTRDPAAARLLMRLSDGHASDAGLLRAPLQATLVALVDLTALTGLRVLLAREAPLFALALSVTSAVVIWRALPAFLALLATSPPAPQHGLFRLRPEVHAQLIRSARWVVGWRIAVNLGRAVALDLFAADRVTQLIDAVGVVAGAFIALWLLRVWTESILEACSDAEPTAVLRWAVAPATGLSRTLRATVGLGALLIQSGGNLTGDLISSTSRFRWFGAVLARRRLQDAELGAEPPSEAILALLREADRPPPDNLTVAARRVAQTHTTWSQDRRRGLVAVVGDRGSGLDLLPEAFGTLVPEARVLRVPRRITRPDEAIAWLSEALGHPGLASAALIAALQRSPTRAVVVMDLHLLLLRTVGGFSALRAVFEVLLETSEEHFWVCGVRASTWRYLEGTPGAVDLAIFREPEHPLAMHADELAAWLLGPLDALGLHPSFSALALGDDPRAEQRARNSWFRLLEDLSQGRPLVALELWRASLRASAVPNAVEHALPRLPATDSLDALDNEDLFLLTALAIHGELELAGLVEVMNRPAGALRAACRRLESLGILTGDERGDRFDIEALMHPQILRLLRQRAFLAEE